MPIAAPSTETSTHSGMSVASHLELEGRLRQRDDGLGSGLALEVDPDLDGDLLALADDDEVDVLDDRLDRVALDVLREREVLLAVDDEGEEGVGRA